MSAYYNEFDKNAAAWLRHLIEEGVIAQGVVDERSITEIDPDDLRGFTQCHFFAGVGVWSYALRLAGWPDDEPVWTGSCPCQPFSAAGKRLGFEDPRHLWPSWLRLIRERRPHRIFGEQSDEADAWIDLVATDLEGHRYAFGAPDVPAAGFGGAHIRQRFYWVADADDAERWAERAPWHDGHWPKTGRVQGDRNAGHGGASGWMANTDGGFAGHRGLQSRGQHGQLAKDGRAHLGLGDAGCHGPAAESRDDGEVRGLPETQRQPEFGPVVLGGSGGLERMVNATGGGCRVGPGGVSYLYQPDSSGVADWLFCRDGLWRPVEPGTFPLVDEAPARMGRLRGYGNAIDAEAAANFIGAYIDARASLASQARAA